MAYIKPINNTPSLKGLLMVCHQLFFSLQLIYTCKYLSVLQKKLTSTICPFHFWIQKSLRASLFKHPEPLLSRGKCCILRVLHFQTHLSCGGWCPGGTSSIIYRRAPCRGLFCLHRSSCKQQLVLNSHPKQSRKRGGTAQNQSFLMVSRLVSWWTWAAHVT